MRHLMKFKSIFLLPLLFLIPLVTYTYPPRRSFLIRIVDQGSGHGVPGVRVIANHRIICYTNSSGGVSWSEQELMDHDVHFSIDRAGYLFPPGGTDLRVAPGGYSELQIQRQNPK
jgi:hypothetical protein